MNIDDVNAAAEAYLKEADGPAATRLRFLMGVWSIQSEAEEGIPAYTAPQADSAREALATRQPLFLVSEPEVPAAPYRATVARIAGYVADEAGLDPAQAAALRDADLSAALTDDRIAGALRDPDGFVSAVAEEVSGDKEGALSTSTVAFLLMTALSPYVTGAAADALAVLGDFDWAIWGSGDCPVCGTAATLGRMSEGNDTTGAVRRLWCSLCHTEWGYERIRCTRCGTRTQEALRYTYEESDPAHRLHLCDTCHGYTKFTFEGELDKPLSMLVEDAASVTLDAIARSQGYAPTGVHAAEETPSN